MPLTGSLMFVYICIVDPYVGMYVCLYMYWRSSRGEVLGCH